MRSNVRSAVQRYCGFQPAGDQLAIGRLDKCPRCPSVPNADINPQAAPPKPGSHENLAGASGSPQMTDNIETGARGDERGPWGPLATIGFSLAIAVVVVLTQLVVAIPYVIVKSMGKSRAAIRATAVSLQSDGLFLALAEVCSAAVGVGLILLIVWLRKG